jgi:hypothetical protein
MQMHGDFVLRLNLVYRVGGYNCALGIDCEKKYDHTEMLTWRTVHHLI